MEFRKGVVEQLTGHPSESRKKVSWPGCGTEREEVESSVCVWYRTIALVQGLPQASGACDICFLIDKEHKGISQWFRHVNEVAKDNTHCIHV